MPVSVADFDYGPERMVVRFEADGPIDLEHLAKSLGSLERLYERQQREHGDLSPAVPSRLFVSRVETGSILVEIAPLLILMNEPLQFMAATNTIKTFSQNMIGLLRQFAGDESGERVPADTDTVKELQQFIKPLTGRKAAELDIVHARYEKKDKDKHVIAEYRMKAPEINIANSNLLNAVELNERLLVEGNAFRQDTKREVLMRLFQASVVDGKESGRTGDRATIAAVTDKDLPLYFPKQSNDFKRIITESTEYPFTKGYIVDVVVEYQGDMPRLYRLLHLHDVVDLE
jgi:hypothetical protein